MFQHQEGTFLASGGIRLYYQSWTPRSQPRAAIALVHGLGGHSDIFTNIVRCLMPCGYAMYGLDLRGHGRSPGQRGYIQAWAEFREDVRCLLRFIQQQEPNLPCFLFGHSLGGVIALDYVLHYPEGLQGIIVTAVPMGKVGVSPLRMVIGQMLSRVWPRFSLDSGIDRTASSRNPAIVAAYQQDPLRHTKATARLATEFLTTTRWIQAHLFDLKVPLLMLHGTSDRVAPPEGSRTFFQYLPFPDKERHEYEGRYHEIQDDLNYLDIMVDLNDWLERHLPSHATLESPECCIKSGACLVSLEME